MKTSSRSLLAACLFAGLGGTALAAPGLTITDVNMRAGRGADTPIVTTVPGGSTINVFDCRGAWCAVSWGRFHGFMNQTYIDDDRAPARVYGYAPPPPVAYGPPVVYGPGPYSPYYYGPRYYGWGWGYRYRRW